MSADNDSRQEAPTADSEDYLEDVVHLPNHPKYL